MIYLFLLILPQMLFASIDLSKYEEKIYSQNGEDGVLRKIFKVIGTTNKYFVEFGVENGERMQYEIFRKALGWSGLLLDGSHENLSINLHQEFITAENINDLFQIYGAPIDFDLLSIDIDFNDFYIWKVLSNYHPRVVVVEYNAAWLPHEDKVVVYHPSHMWDQTNYFGASILSLVKLGQLKGYTLVYAESRGVNLFFIRSDIVNHYPFKNAGNTEKLYQPPKYGLGPNGGHTADPYQRPYLTFEEALLLN